jgi:hypothetical protein
VTQQNQGKPPHSQNTSIRSEKTDKRRQNKPKECTDATPFKSKYKEGYITPANFLAESIFEKRNEFFNSGKCPERFWVTGNKLHGAYKGQVIAASKLLKKYHVDSIIKALKSNDAKFIFKLQDKKLEPIIQTIENSRVEKEVLDSYNTPSEVSKPFRNTKKNILKDL